MEEQEKEALEVLRITDPDDNEVASEAIDRFRSSPLWYEWHVDQKEQQQQLKSIMEAARVFVEIEAVDLSTFVMAAIRSGNVTLLKSLLKEVPNSEINYLNTQSISKELPLNYACKRIRYFSEINFAIIRLLLSNGADPNAKDGDSKISLHYAVDYHGRNFDDTHLRIISLLISSKVKRDMQDAEGKTPLHYLCDMLTSRLREAKSAIELLLSNDQDCANPNVQDNKGQALLHKLCKRSSSFHYDDNKSSYDIAKLLLSRGADPDLRDKRGRKPVYYAGNGEIRKLLGAVNTGSIIIYSMLAVCSMFCLNINPHSVSDILITVAFACAMLYFVYSAIQAMFPEPSPELVQARAICLENKYKLQDNGNSNNAAHIGTL